MQPTDRLARSALAAWASLLGDDLTVTEMPTATNPLWRVDVRDQAALVLKQLPKHPPGVEPVVEFRVLSHLQSAGISVAPPIMTDAGSIHATVDERNWALLPFLPHQPGNHELGPDARTNAVAVGAAIGGLDRALADYSWPVASYVDEPAEILEQALPRLPEEVIQLVRPFTHRLAEACTDPPVQLTHGDCNDGNVLVDPGRAVGFIDIDHLPTGPRVRDLAYYLASRLRRHLDNPDTATRATAAFSAVLSCYLAGYHQAYPLTPYEVSAVVPLMLLVEIGGAHWSLHGWEPNIDRYRRNLRSISWLTAHFDDLVTSAEEAI